MSNLPVRDILKRQLRQVQDKLEGLEGDRMVTIHIDEVVSVTIPVDVWTLKLNISSKLDDIYTAENEEVEAEIAERRKGVNRG